MRRPADGQEIEVNGNDQAELAKFRTYLELVEKRGIGREQAYAQIYGIVLFDETEGGAQG